MSVTESELGPSPWVMAKGSRSVRASELARALAVVLGVGEGIAVGVGDGVGSAVGVGVAAGEAAAGGGGSSGRPSHAVKLAESASASPAASRIGSERRKWRTTIAVPSRAPLQLTNVLAGRFRRVAVGVRR